MTDSPGARATGSAFIRPTRRTVLGSGVAMIGASCASQEQARQIILRGTPDVRLSIAPHTLELAPGVNVQTLAYNGTIPGPVIRLREGRRALIEVENLTATPELVHWHGLYAPSDVDGALEEGTPQVDPFQTRRYAFAPTPAGTHWYHTHAMGGKNLDVGAYTGLFGFFIVENGEEPGAYDQEVLIAMHHWGSRWVAGQGIRPDQPNHGLEIAYDYATMNGRLLGHADPIRVRQGERVMFRLLNASATEMTWTCLAGHKMRLVGLDGLPTPVGRDIETLMLGPGERADLLVEMNNPGRWVLGSPIEAERAAGMGVVVEYAGAKGDATWLPLKRDWDYLWFARQASAPAGGVQPDSILNLTIDRIAGGAGGHNTWTFNGQVWPHTPRLYVRKGQRYRLAVHNKTDHGHPFHLHRHHFEVASYGGTPAAGLFKDTINIRPFQTVELDFVANNPGPTLLHCHQAKHQDFGLMALILYEGDVEPYVDHEAMRMTMNAACGD